MGVQRKKTTIKDIVDMVNSANEKQVLTEQSTMTEIVEAINQLNSPQSGSQAGCNSATCATCNYFSDGVCHHFQPNNALNLKVQDGYSMAQGIYAQFRPDPETFCCNQYTQRSED